MGKTLLEYYKSTVYPIEEVDLCGYNYYMNDPDLKDYDINQIGVEILIHARPVEWVYVIYNPDNNLYKIGETSEPEHRLSNLRTASGCDLKPIIRIRLEPLWDEKSKIVERTLHKFFKDKRRIGEWFELNDDDVNIIKELFWDVIEGYDIVEN